MSCVPVSNMLRTIHTSLSPNAERDDVALAVSLLLRPWTWKHGTGADLLEKRFARMFDGASVFSWNSGRSCFFSILSSLELKSGDEVLLQTFTCVAVPEPILWVGAKPVYVDCDQRTFNMDIGDLERKITPRSKVLVVQHTFGKPADIGRIMEIAEKHGLFVIEDCAHALGARVNGRLVGSFGDAAFFSFGRDKVISSVFGGMLVVRDRQIADALRSATAPAPLPSNAWIAQQLFHPICLSIVKQTYDWHGFGKGVVEVAKRLHLISKAVLPIEKRGGKPGFIGKRLSNYAAVRNA